MSIWTYSDWDLQHDASEHWKSAEDCRYCSAPMTWINRKETWYASRRYDDGRWYPVKAGRDGRYRCVTGAWVCGMCGWWLAIVDDNEVAWGGDIGIDRFRIGGVLRRMSLGDASTAIDDVRDYLVAKYSNRGSVHWKSYQDAVTSVFADHGYTIVSVGYIRDDGIDAVATKDDVTVGVQVKRWRNSIQVAQIDAFCGALVRAGLTHGVFVTTSAFTRGAKKAVGTLGGLVPPMKIELVDAQRFLEQLTVAQRNPYRDLRELDLRELVMNLGSLDRGASSVD